MVCGFFSGKYVYSVDRYTDKMGRLNAQVKKQIKLPDSITGISCGEENSRYYNTNYV